MNAHKILSWMKKASLDFDNSNYYSINEIFFHKNYFGNNLICYNIYNH